MVRKPPPKKSRIVSDVRSPHGTRVMKRIVCSSCQKSDTLSYVPKAGEPVLCKDCSARSNVVTEGDSMSADRMVSCKKCGTPFPLAKKPREVFVPKGLEGMADLLSPRDAMTLCASCRNIVAEERRNLAKKPRGVHPVVVKKRISKVES
jgi:CxxC-x17-CxxC domain-containing protein